MGRELARLKLGQEVEARVVEIFANGDAVVVYDGDLVRVSNRTNTRFRLGQRLLLRVTATQPLAFQMIGPVGSFRAKIDVSV